jgi:uncharacterized membrane protein YeaQ/YmgE (transglycosylase-associated protein family)
MAIGGKIRYGIPEARPGKGPRALGYLNLSGGLDLITITARSTGRAKHGEFCMRLSSEGLLVILFVGLIAGWLAGQIVRGTGFGIIGDILVGIAGALVASLLFPRLGIHLGTGLVREIIYSAIGAILLLLIVRLVRTGGRF